MKRISLIAASLMFLLFTACNKENPAPPPSCDGFEVTVSQQGNTQLVANPTGGTSPYTYLWSAGETTANITIDPSVTGSYTVVVTDANGCTANATFEVTNDPCDSFYAELFITDSAFISMTLEGGASPFSYEWSTGETSATIIPSADGTYSVTVTDANGCTTSDDIDYVGDPCANTDLMATISFENDPTDGASLFVLPSGGEAPFSYSWDNGSTDQTIYVAAGTYTVTVTDGNGCTTSASYTIEANCADFVAYLDRDDSITTVIHFDAHSENGLAPFSYEWGGLGTDAPDQSWIEFNLGTSGPISVTITDANGCSAEAGGQF